MRLVRAVLCAILVCLHAQAWAQAYPNHSVRVVVPYLTVDTVRYQIGKRTRLGVASTFLAGRIKPGDKLIVRIEIRADRIDQFADGTFGILDYKTTDNLNTRDWDGERPDAPQLPLYAVKSERQISAVHFAQLKPGDVKMIGYDGAEVDARIDDWARVIEQLGAGFVRGEAAVNPKDPRKTCEFCNLTALCRIGELSGAAGAEEDGE